MIRLYKACQLCFRLFQQKQGQSEADFANQEYCPACDVYIRLSKPSNKPAPATIINPPPKPVPPTPLPTVPPTPPVKNPSIKAEATLEAVVESIVARPERKAPEFLMKKKKQADTGNRMRTLYEACAVYAQMRNMPVESAMKLWGLK